MNTYLFTFNCVPTDNSWWTTYNKKNYFEVSADSIKEAEEKFFIHLSKDLFFEVSKTARRKYNKMYIDTKEGTSKQVGKVFKASTEIEWSNKNPWKKVFADIWTEIKVLNNPFEA